MTFPVNTPPPMMLDKKAVLELIAEAKVSAAAEAQAKAVVQRMYDDVERLQHFIFGNGKEGLVTRMDKSEMHLQHQTDKLNGILRILAGIGVVVLGQFVLMLVRTLGGAP